MIDSKKAFLSVVPSNVGRLTTEGSLLEFQTLENSTFEAISEICLSKVDCFANANSEAFEKLSTRLFRLDAIFTSRFLLQGGANRRYSQSFDDSLCLASSNGQASAIQQQRTKVKQ